MGSETGATFFHVSSSDLQTKPNVGWMNNQSHRRSRMQANASKLD
jgi:hypothetical protein